jgi:hypothetical protein
MRTFRYVLAALAAAVALARGSLWADVDARAGRQQPPATRQVKEPEADPRSVSADARRSSREFWAKLPSAKRAALERELDRLEGRARRGDVLDNELSQLRAGYPALFQTETALRSARWVAAAPGGSTQAFVCSGIVIIRRDGRVICIGGLKIRG